MITTRQLDAAIREHAITMGDFTEEFEVYDYRDLCEKLQWSMARLKRIMDAFMLQEETS